MITKEAIEKCKAEYKKVTDEMIKLAGQIDTLDPVADVYEIRKYSKQFDVLDSKADGMLLIMNAVGYTMYRDCGEIIVRKVTH